MNIYIFSNLSNLNGNNFELSYNQIIRLTSRPIRTTFGQFTRNQQNQSVTHQRKERGFLCICKNIKELQQINVHNNGLSSRYMNMGFLELLAKMKTQNKNNPIQRRDGRRRIPAIPAASLANRNAEYRAERTIKSLIL